MIRRITKVNELKKEERCAKHEEALAKKIVEEEQNEKSLSSEEQIQATKEDELPFEDILADQRRKYTPTQKYVQLLYNDLVKNFIKKWDGTFLRKTLISIKSSDQFSAEKKKESRIESTKDDEEAMIDEKTSTIYLKPDEMVQVVFVNGNIYTGRVSKQKMEGEGIYRWHNGSQYKGSFEDNKIQGKGKLEWQDYVTYEGDLEDGYCHGKGTMMDKNYNFLYIGEWKKGYKHGKGYCRYAENDSYDGNWVMDKREGVGSRLYKNGACYIGDYKNNLCHGTGTMTWANGDCYRGQWNQGEMHGYGEYTWNKHFKGSFCWPQETCYIGQWNQNKRNGKGQLTLNSIGAARYSGLWKDNKKHGYGKIIGNNGDVTEDDPLFLNDILQPISTSKNYPEKGEENNTFKDINTNDLQKFVTKPPTILEARMTSVLKPEQCPSLSYYINRLQEANTIPLFRSSSFNVSLISGKCKECEKLSCHCLTESMKQLPQDQDHKSRSLSKESSLNAKSHLAIFSSDLNQSNDDISTRIVKKNDANLVQLEKEESWAYKCIAMHMPRIRKVYEIYSKMFCNESPKCKLSMSRFSLWQLWRDCKIHETNLSLVQIDKYLAANKSTLIEDPHCPYERIEIWQLINALLEVSWHLYAKNGDLNEGGYPGRIANGLHKLLINDIYPNFGNCTGIMCESDRDFLPIDPVYQLYKLIGKPHSARQLLITICTMKGTKEEDPPESSMSATFNFNPEVRNTVTVEENLSYLSRDEPKLDSYMGNQLEERDRLLRQSLLPLQKLGATELIQIMSVTCPTIKDPKSDVDINLEYELTFLEFLEIFIQACKILVWKQKVQREIDKKKAEAAETTSIISATKGYRTNRSSIRVSEGNASTKSRKKLVKKY